MSKIRPLAASALAIAMIAGTCASALAVAPAAIRVAGDQQRLTFNGRVFHTSSGPVSNLRTLAMPGSKTVLMTWTERQQGADVAYYAYSNNGQVVNQVEMTENKVRLQYQTFDPSVETPAVPAALQAGAENELFLVQFVATPIDPMRQQITSLGGAVERFLTDNTHIVRMSPAVRDQVAQLPYVRWVGAMHPAYRTDAQTRSELVAGTDADLPVRYSIEVMRNDGTQQTAVAQFINQIGGVVEMTQDIGTYRMEASLTKAQLLQVLNRNEVNFVDPWGAAGTDTVNARAIGGVTSVIHPAGFRGQGVRGQVQDSEVQTTHPAWNGQVPLINGGVAALGTHGTACYGINFSTGAGGFTNVLGFLPEREQGVFAYYGSLSGFGGAESRLTRTQNAVNPAGNFRVVYESNSWGSAQVTTYTTASAEMDNIIFQTGLFILNSQSNTNNQNSRPQAWAKNVTAIGGINHVNTVARTDDNWAGASIGPAADGRTKPDLAHFYDQTPATWPTSTTTVFSGTSNATPVTAGHSGLFMQMWHSGVWAGFGGQSTVFASRPEFTTAKAALAASAFRYNWLLGGANASIQRRAQGWGMVDLAKLYSYRTGLPAGGSNETIVVNETDVLNNGDTKSYQIVVAAGEPELLVSMSYNDPQGTVGAAQARINDLSLRVTAPNGTIYWGNNGLNAGNYNTTGGVANTIDTTENVFVQNPAAGSWRVEVLGTQIVSDTVANVAGTNADYGMWIMGATLQGAPACYANCDGSTTAPVLNALDFSCFLNRYVAGDSYANCDASTTPPILNALDFSCFLSSYIAGCP